MLAEQSLDLGDGNAGFKSQLGQFLNLARPQLSRL
jgi:hypothetical protein